MKLDLIRIAGYKRLADKQALDTRGPLVAVVGPNEAGKTSLLKAIEHLSTGAKFETSELTDREAVDDSTLIVEAHFSLDAEDRQALGSLLPHGIDPTYKLLAFADGEVIRDISPAFPRDKTVRKEMASRLAKWAQTGWFETVPSTGEQVPSWPESLPTLVQDLNSEKDWLSDDIRAEIARLASDIKGTNPNRTELTRSNQLRKLHRVESEATPEEKIMEILFRREPRFLRFREAERTLLTEYEWDEHPTAPPPLANLFELAQTDYSAYRAAAQADDRPRLGTLQENAEKALDEAFAVWHQGDLHVTFSADSRSLQLIIRDRATSTRTRLDERSDGLRRFIALVAFTARYGGRTRPILLIDEAETHLHYGAQADLVRVFERQQAAETIIYTTHSIGCLPEDLGATIRVVSPVEGTEYRSAIHNSIWAGENNIGLTPMMLAMGANALAFTPTRRVVIGEGTTEAILLPTLIRESLPGPQQIEPLGYQVAPGVSEVDPEKAAGLELEAGGVAYLIDSDDGGRGHRRKLSARAKREGRIVVLGNGEIEGICIEDYVDAEVLAQAFNNLLRYRRVPEEKRVASDDLPSAGRGAYLDTWCRRRQMKPLNKVHLAQETIQVGRDLARLVDDDRKPALRALHKQLLKATSEPDD